MSKDWRLMAKKYRQQIIDVVLPLGVLLALTILFSLGDIVSIMYSLITFNFRSAWFELNLVGYVWGAIITVVPVVFAVYLGNVLFNKSRFSAVVFVLIPIMPLFFTAFIYLLYKVFDSGGNEALGWIILFVYGNICILIYAIVYSIILFLRKRKSVRVVSDKKV